MGDGFHLSLQFFLLYFGSLLWTLPLPAPKEIFFRNLSLAIILSIFILFFSVGFFLSIFKHGQVSSILTKILLSFRLHPDFSTYWIGLITHSFLSAPAPSWLLSSPSPCSPVFPPISPGILPSCFCRFYSALNLNIGVAWDILLGLFLLTLLLP